MERTGGPLKLESKSVDSEYSETGCGERTIGRQLRLGKK